MKMGITMIEMYCDMVRQQFESITDTLNARNLVLQEKCKTQAKKDLGIYTKLAKLAKLNLEAQELEHELKAYTESYYLGGKRYDSKVDQLTKEYMSQVQNGIHKKVHHTMNDMIFKIKLSGLDGDTREIFEKLPGVVKELSKEI